MATEQELYEFLYRIDHPVFPRDMSTVTNAISPFNSIMNRLWARQLVKLNVAVASLQANAFPQTADENTIDRWEETYFGYNTPGLPLADRITNLLVKINQRLTMSVTTVIAVAQAITGQTPTVVRNIYWRGWVIGQSAIGRTTIIGTGTAGAHSSKYVLIFDSSIDPTLKKRLDTVLTAIEKGGSSHSIVSPLRLWIIGRSAIGVDTTIGE
jgi:hypothetical protein